MSPKSSFIRNSFFILFVLMAVSSLVAVSSLATGNPGRPGFKTNILRKTFRFNADTKKSVSLRDLKQGCPARDCIPSIDKPRFVAVDKANFLTDDEYVIVVNYDGKTKIYSRNILEHHEIVNDWFGSLPVAVTFCPLCGSAVAVVRIVDGKATEFGVSGVLHNSDLVMYDRNTHSLWGQLTGTAIVGEKTGTRLRKLSAQLMRWKLAKKTYKKAQVLSKDTGFNFSYNKVAYQKYYDNAKVIFPVSLSDARANRKAVVYGISVNGKNIAYTEDYLKKNPDFKQKIAGINLQISTRGEGDVRAKNIDSGEDLPVTHAYWFAWYNFHPKTILVGGKKGQ